MVENEKVSVRTNVCQAQLKVMHSKCNDDCVRFLVQNETPIDASVRRAQMAVVHNRHVLSPSISI